MSVDQGLQVLVGDAPVDPPDGWEGVWVGDSGRVLRLTDGTRSVTVVVEGDGTDWTVTLRGRRVPVRVLSRRERLIAEADTQRGPAGGHVEIAATLPGLIAAVRVEAGSEVVEGQPLITIEAMKMQNDVRAPRAGRVAEIFVAAGQTVRSGQPLARLE